MDEEEMRLVQLAQNGHEGAMLHLVTRHYPLIHGLSRRICSGGMEKETLIQAGMLGLIEAVKHYQQAREVKLITYAVPWILGEMKKALRQEVMPSAGFYTKQTHEPEETSFLERVQGCDGIDLGKVDLHIAFEKLGRVEQKLLMLRYYRGKTQKETAEIMKKSQAQISRMESRVLDTLHALLS